MTATKKAAKKAAAPKKRAASTKITLKDDTLYVLSLRGKYFMWEPSAVYETMEEAKLARDSHEQHSNLGFSAAKITRVKLVK